ncbi:MAG: ribonuclease III [Lachnospiraceae bacterium]|nr:ribonuclease III [Lachnospiraceae bacterium]
MAQSLDLFEIIRKEFEEEKVDIRTYSPLSLAYIGDSIYDLIIRSYVVGKGNTSNNKLHKVCTSYVSAKAQSYIAGELLPKLSEEEASVYKRGRNSKPQSGAKNATLSEYLKATGFEALLGYLFLEGRTERLMELVKEAIRITDERIDN